LEEEKAGNIELGSGFGRFLAAKIKFSYGAVQTVNLLALRLQWFESTPTQASPRAAFECLSRLAGNWGFQDEVTDSNLFPTRKTKSCGCTRTEPRPSRFFIYLGVNAGLKDILTDGS
jgi:hypothetical protein